METFSRRSAVIKKGRHISKKRRFGTFLYRLSEGSKHFMIEKFCIEI
jgi:hypothetical protein